MSIFDVLSLLGGLAMFLYGMRLMGDSLKENSSGTLKSAMEKVTNNPIKAFILGLLVTALIQSSTATIVITSGLVAAGILSLKQSLGIIIGANVGTTVTGQIIRLLDLDSESGVAEWLRFFQPSTLAPIALIVGIALIMFCSFNKARTIGNIAIGFGVLFSGLLNMTSAVAAIKESSIIEQLFTSLGSNPLFGYLTGAGIAFVLQSSSATVGILQAFSSTGLLTWKSIYAVIVGIYLGDCVTTAIVCSIGAKPDAKRVGIVNILFNIGKTILILAAVLIIHQLGFLDNLWEKTVNSGIIADTNTIFNLGSAVLLMPLIGVFEKLSLRIVKDEEGRRGKYQDKLDALNPVFFSTPALALKGCYDVLMTMFEASRDNIGKATQQLTKYNEDAHAEILDEEDEIDNMTDKVSRYLVELMPHMTTDDHVTILNQYYKVTGEFERMGDHAVHIAELADGMHEARTEFSPGAKKELEVLFELMESILNQTETAFARRDVDATENIEPLVRVAAEFINQMRKNHFTRMSRGECNILADAIFTNLLMECKRVTDACSNVGVAIMIRINPELADQEHIYIESLQKGINKNYNKAFEKAHKYYFGKLEEK
ncbi:MAG: Na/Pi cotransporter family protein [Clostridiales bacterium]|nr:Na/Pi cotransporter family protein [Clostridiales bacterium]